MKKKQICLRLWFSMLGTISGTRVVVLCSLVNLNADCELQLFLISDLFRFGDDFEVLSDFRL